MWIDADFSRTSWWFMTWTRPFTGPLLLNTTLHRLPAVRIINTWTHWQTQIIIIIATINTMVIDTFYCNLFIYVLTVKKVSQYGSWRLKIWTWLSDSSFCFNLKPVVILTLPSNIILSEFLGFNVFWKRFSNARTCQVWKKCYDIKWA